jgi:cAMP-dependent protein kinase regulator
MGSGSSTEHPTSRIPQPPSNKAFGARSKKKDKHDGKHNKDISSVDDTPATKPTASVHPPPTPVASSTPPNGTTGGNYAILLQQHQQQQAAAAPSNNSVSNPLAGNAGSASNPQLTPTTSSQQMAGPGDADLFARKATFRQVIKRALELAQEQRQRYGKFRKDEKRAVMELYEVLGLDEDTFLAPPNELQKRITNYKFPPPNMHMLLEQQVVDEETLEYVLGTDEAKLRKAEGLEVAPAMVKRHLEVDTGPRRVGVSSEGTQALMKTNAVFKNIPKTKEQGERLLSAINQCPLFRILDTSDIKVLFNAFEKEDFASNTSIFDQGDEGDKFYLIDHGRCHVVVKDAQGREVHSLFLGDGDTFGELAIMYGMPRAATVTAVVETVCWWIDRDTYRGMLLKETMRKRDKYIKFLESVPLFQNVDAYEKARIADVLEVQEIQGRGAVIIREGEPGDTFYLIEEGEVKFETMKDGEVFERRKQGSFFGEMALLFDRPRMASVVAQSNVVRLLTLNRSNFNNYLGPLDDILRRNAEQYRQYVAKAQGSSA